MFVLSFQNTNLLNYFHIENEDAKKKEAMPTPYIIYMSISSDYLSQ